MGYEKYIRLLFVSCTTLSLYCYGKYVRVPTVTWGCTREEEHVWDTFCGGIR